MTKFKGPVFPSYTDAFKNFKGGKSGQAGPSRALPKGAEYIAHTGMKARTRFLRQQCRSIHASKDPRIMDAILLVKDKIAHEPNQEFLLNYILHNANLTAKEANLDFYDTVEFLTKKIVPEAVSDVKPELPKPNESTNT